MNRLLFVVSIMLHFGSSNILAKNLEVLESWKVKDSKYLFSKMDSVYSVTSKPNPLSFHISQCSYDYIHAIFEKKTLSITNDDKLQAAYECKCFYNNYARKYEYSKFKSNPMKYTKLELKNGSIDKCREQVKKEVAETNRLLKENKKKPSYDAVKYTCNQWLIHKKYSKGSWQRKSSDYPKAIGNFQKKYGKITEKQFLKDYCKPHVKKQICSLDRITGYGIMPDYFGYGYPDINALFGYFKDSSEVAKKLCKNKKQFETHSRNDPKTYKHSTK